MFIRKADINEVDEICDIYEKARNFMVKSGNPTQWASGYPKRELVIDDIQKGECYVCIDNDKIAAVFNFFVGHEPTYDVIYEGNWLNNAPYGVVHRIAVNVHQKGVASFCINWCKKQFANLKIDTHKDNIPMQKTILKNGFVYCGIIKKPDGSSRLAYQMA